VEEVLMTVQADAQRETDMKSSIEAAIEEAAATPGSPQVAIKDWLFDGSEPELTVIVGGKQRVLEVQQEFLSYEPDTDALRKVATAARALMKGDIGRVKLYHQGVFGVWEH
jgi:hypothetical protein